tara:strand:- start:2409 stop:2897 length:489 start_codon:yes stop_codon:yes gene_type:complete
MKVLDNIPLMDDNKLAILFSNALEMKRKKKNEDNANLVISAVQSEWRIRLDLFKQGNYKADRPDQGILATVGYKVGNDGVSKEIREYLLDYIITSQLPPIGSPAYISEWGEENSPLRYKKLHRVIRVLASSAISLGNMNKAATEWEEDLLYIEEKWSYLKNK